MGYNPSPYSGGGGATLVVDPSGDATGVTDAKNINAAVTALPAGGGTVQMGEGAWHVECGQVSINRSGVYLQGAGKWATYVNAVGAGDVFRMYDSSTYDDRTVQGGGILGMTVDGTATTGNSAGIHLGDIFQAQLNVACTNFNAGTTSKCVWLDNEYYWTEGLSGYIYASNGTSLVVFDNPSSGAATSLGSFDRADLIIYLEQGVNGSGNLFGDGVVFQNGAICVDGAFAIRGNFQTSAAATTAAVLRLTGTTPGGHAETSTSSIIASRVDIGVELDSSGGGNSPFTINMGASGNILSQCYGTLDFGANPSQTYQSCNNPDNIQGFFVVNGDTAISPANGYPAFKGPVIYSAGYMDPTGYIVPNQGDFFSLTLSENTTMSLLFADAGAPQRITFVITQAASGGPYTLTWPTSGSPSTSSPNITWAGGVVPQMSTTASAVDVYVLTTADGAHWYGQAIQSSQVADVEQFTAITGTHTLAANTNAQAIFNASSNGAVTLQASTSYWFECEFDLTSLSSSSHTLSFGFGGAASFTSIKYRVDSNTGAAGTLATWNSAIVTAATATAFTAAVTTTTAQAVIRGILRISSTGGTVIPQLTQGTNGAAAVVSANSWFRVVPIGSSSVTSVGNWS